MAFAHGMLVVNDREKHPKKKTHLSNVLCVYIKIAFLDIIYCHQNLSSNRVRFVSILSAIIARNCLNNLINFYENKTFCGRQINKQK